MLQQDSRTKATRKSEQRTTTLPFPMKTDFPIWIIIILKAQPTWLDGLCFSAKLSVTLALCCQKISSENG